MTRKAKPTSPKISAFCAQLITVRGLITVEMSPLMKPWRDRSATLIIFSTSALPPGVSYSPDLASTICASVAAGR